MEARLGHLPALYILLIFDPYMYRMLYLPTFIGQLVTYQGQQSLGGAKILILSFFLL